MRQDYEGGTFVPPHPDSIPLSPGTPLARSFSVRVEFDQRVAEDDLLDIVGNPGHSLFDFLPQVTTNAAGCAEIELTVPGSDVWTSVLTAMIVIRQSGFDPAAVHVTHRHPPYRVVSVGRRHSDDSR